MNDAQSSLPPALPASRGPARATLMLVHPRRLFLYWIKDDALEQAIASASGVARLHLEASIAGEPFAEVDQREFDFRAPGWYLPFDKSDCRVRARLGITEGGNFRSLLLSNEVRVPRERPGGEQETWQDLWDLRKNRSPAREGSSPSGEKPWDGTVQLTTTARRASAVAPMPSTLGYLAMVLHAHLPFVRHPEREYFLEEHWLFEAITETYLPILDLLGHLSRDHVPARLTMSLTPTLMAMLRDSLLIEKYSRHLDRMCELAGREVARTRREAGFASTAGFYQDRLLRFRSMFHEEYRKDLVSQFAR
ncbi:MAG: DUF4912 domain-containing protein, partial [Acidobacteria bacterium]|nr:DUF4912 domain-containing protein [Acidobacteriota bacterium]